jgi:hypothetical protein
VLASDRDDALLAELKPKDIGRTLPHPECLSGTRADIFSKIDEWLEDISAPNILWINGHPGVGKSAIASSLVKRLVQSKRLGASFFFQRDNTATTNPNALWRMVAFELSRQYPSVRKSLVAKLRADDIRPTTINTKNLFRHCIFDSLVASGDIPPGRLPVIVVDALDECGGLEGLALAQREALMQSVYDWSQLPSNCKLIVTSRSEMDIEQAFHTISHSSISISTGEDVDKYSANDIRAYLKHEFQEIVSHHSILLNTEWPGESIIDALTTKAAGLFIWAKTLIKFIKMGSPKSQLRLILEGNGFSGMADLYSQLLEIAFPEQSVESSHVTRSILAAMILAKRPLSASTIAKLLNIENDIMEYFFIRMRSVLSTQNPLQISHQSFVDFLLDGKACLPAFLINLDYWRRYLTISCLNMMEEGLKFNICELDSSYFRNSDIPDLDMRIETHILPALSYSCLFWAQHLSESDYDDEIYYKIQEFMDNRFLYWLEVLSLCRQVNQASRTLRVLTDWMRVSSIRYIFYIGLNIARLIGKQER